MSYFKNFSRVPYSFGNNEAPVLFQNLGTYIDIVDQVKDEVSAYRFYYIKEGDRPDQLAYLLYEDVNMYWTFFLANDHIRESGWPLTEEQLVEKVKKDHPDFVITTQNNLSGIFKVGQTVRGSSSGQTGTIQFRNLDLGQLFISGASGAFLGSEVVTSQVGSEVQSVTLTGAVEELNSIDHFINGEGKRVDIDPYADAPALFTPVTRLEKYRNVNDSLKRIKVLKPNVISQIAERFREELTS
tara:strand:- start:6166 stop:6891 length:726 start_codon:yes stop_codon:yes gene_type:complete